MARTSSFPTNGTASHVGMLPSESARSQPRLISYSSAAALGMERGGEEVGGEVGGEDKQEGGNQTNQTHDTQAQRVEELLELLLVQRARPGDVLLRPKGGLPRQQEEEQRARAVDVRGMARVERREAGEQLRAGVVEGGPRERRGGRAGRAVDAREEGGALEACAGRGGCE